MAGPAFVFDMSGVLLDFDLQAIKQRVAEASGTPVAEIDRTWRDDPYEDCERGQMSGRDYYRHYAARVRLGWSYERWIDEWSRIVTRNEDGTPLFEVLRAAGRPVYVLSNLAEYHRDAASAAVPGFWEASCGNFLSFELGLCKPTTAIFEAACARIGRPPQECYFFDDDEANISSANRLGMRAFLFCAENMPVIRRAVAP